MDAFLQAVGGVGQWTGTIVWAVGLGACCLAVLLSLPGGWIALALAVGFDALHGFGAIGPARLIVFAVLLAVGEAAEAFLGSVYVAARGATAWAERPACRERSAVTLT